MTDQSGGATPVPNDERGNEERLAFTSRVKPFTSSPLTSDLLFLSIKMRRGKFPILEKPDSSIAASAAAAGVPAGAVNAS